MSARPAKRARVDTDDDFTPSQYRNAELPAREEIDSLVADLHENDCRHLLSQAAMDHPGVLRSLRALLRARELEISMNVVDFRHHPKEVWKVLNHTYRNEPEWLEMEIAGDVERSIYDRVNDIVSKASIPNASFGTKRNGLDALRKIAKIVIISPTRLGYEIELDWQWDPTMVDAMKKVVNAMSSEDHASMLQWNDGRGRWQTKLEELIKLAEDNCCLEGMGDTLEILLGKSKDKEDEDQDDDSDEREEQDDVKEESDDGHNEGERIANELEQLNARLRFYDEQLRIHNAARRAYGMAPFQII
ncbi:hypothetical protein DTO271G3_7649 [Paecilomyces variotii]|nr:hypothetical protein DTO271G3_7649 [Paecilomyces variotii]